MKKIIIFILLVLAGGDLLSQVKVSQIRESKKASAANGSYIYSVNNTDPIWVYEVCLPDGSVEIRSVRTDAIVGLKNCLSPQIDSLGIANLGYVAGPHTIDTDTNIDSLGVVGLGFVAGPHTVDTDTNIDSLGITNLGFVAGPKTIIPPLFNSVTDVYNTNASGDTVSMTRTYLNDLGGTITTATMPYTEHTVDTDTWFISSVVNDSIHVVTDKDGNEVSRDTIRFPNPAPISEVGELTFNSSNGTLTHANSVDGISQAIKLFCENNHYASFTDTDAANNVGCDGDFTFNNNTRTFVAGGATNGAMTSLGGSFNVIHGNEHISIGAYSSLVGRNNRSLNYADVSGLGNTATGDYVKIGGLNNTYGAYGLGSGNGNTGLSYSLANGVNNSIANFGIVNGQNNTTNGWYSAANGANNSLNDRSLAIGDGNTGAGQYDFLLGKDNIGNSAYNFAMGQGNVLSNIYNYAFGLDNNISGGSYSGAHGSDNAVVGFNSFTFGLANSILTNGSFAQGNGNAVTGQESAVFGLDNVQGGSKSLMWGFDNSSDENSEYNLVGGILNKTTGDVSYSVVLGEENETFENSTYILSTNSIINTGSINSGIFAGRSNVNNTDEGVIIGGSNYTSNATDRIGMVYASKLTVYDLPEHIDHAAAQIDNTLSEGALYHITGCSDVHLKKTGVVAKAGISNQWTDAGRPASPVIGEVGFNTNSSNFEIFDGVDWRAFAESPVVSTANTIQFYRLEVYGSTMSPISGDIIFDLTKANGAKEQVVLHQDATIPNFPSTAVVYGNYTPNAINSMTIRYIDATRIEVFISS